jgi:hypothetical protein
VPFVFGDRVTFLGKGETQLSEQVMAYWTNFAATGKSRGASQAAGGSFFNPKPADTFDIPSLLKGNPNKAGSNNPSAPALKAQWPEFKLATTDHLVLVRHRFNLSNLTQ